MDTSNRAIMRMLEVCDANRGAGTREMAKACGKLREVQALTKKQRAIVAVRWRRLRTQPYRDKLYRAMCLYCVAENKVSIAKHVLEAETLRLKWASKVDWASVCGSARRIHSS